jgi:catechol 2,3-dioxygenase-like lactoylglutathione lyase family enzyme
VFVEDARRTLAVTIHGSKDREETPYDTLFEEILDPMEQLITKLLRDFEDGFLNRRQLIQNLGLAFAAALGGKVLAQTPAGKPAGAPDSPFKAVELDHISYQVNDYRVTRDFYADLMGMEVKNDNGKTQCELYFGSSMLLARNRNRSRGGDATGSTPPETSTSASTAVPQAGNRPPRPAPTSLVDHLAYRIYNWDTDQVRDELMRRKLLAENARPDTGGGIPGYSSFHVSDPDGFNLQISGWAGPKDSVTKKK